MVTSERFPRDWTGEGGVGDGIAAAWARLPAAAWMVTTLGTRGSVLLERCPPGGGCGSAEAAAGEVALEALLPGLFEEAAAAGEAAGAEVACVSASGVEVR